MKTVYKHTYANDISRSRNKVVFLLADDESSESSRQIEKRSAKLKDIGATIVTISMGQNSGVLKSKLIQPYNVMFVARRVRFMHEACFVCVNVHGSDQEKIGLWS